MGVSFDGEHQPGRWGRGIKDPPYDLGVSG